MSLKYILMHKDNPVLECQIEDSTIIKINDIYNSGHIPFGTLTKGLLSKKNLSTWLKGRSIPASREGIALILGQLKIKSTEDLIEKCYGLSLSDQYWIKPTEHDISWKNINFFDNDFSEDLGSLLLYGKTESQQINLFTPNNTSDGWLPKKWKIIDGKRCLIKAGSDPYRQEPLNEKIASELNKILKIPHIDYDVFYEKEIPYSTCDNYITKDTEMITAIYLSVSEKQPGSVSDYQHYVNVCKHNGLEHIEDYMDRTIVTDYIMANRDRHWTNFGIVRNANTLQFLEPFPSFDNGTSLWNNTQDFLIGREEPIGKMFGSALDKHLKYVKDVSWIDFKELKVLPEIANNILSNSLYITEERRTRLCNIIKSRINALEQNLTKRIFSISMSETTREKKISSSPNERNHAERIGMILKALVEIPAFKITHDKNQIDILSKQGLTARYYVNTDKLYLKIKNEYTEADLINPEDIILAKWFFDFELLKKSFDNSR